jgi:hypothetical protein
MGCESRARFRKRAETEIAVGTFRFVTSIEKEGKKEMVRNFHFSFFVSLHLNDSILFTNLSRCVKHDLNAVLKKKLFSHFQ